MVLPKATYADLILPLALGKLFTYRIPDSVTEIQPGQRVVVQFGKTKMYTALVYRLHHDKPEFYQAKDIIEVLDSTPVVNENQFRLWEWLSEYYLCTLGEIMVAALPAVMKLQSESVVSLNDSFNLEGVLLTSEEQQVIDLLKERK